MRSYWEHRSLVDHELVVIGGGFVGLSCALALRARAPDASILVLERGVPAAGASLRNAGFACFGSLTELAADVRRDGLLPTVRLVARRHAGLRRLLELVDHDADHRATGGWELLRHDRVDDLDLLDTLDEALRPILGGPAMHLDDGRLDTLGFDRDTVAHLVSLPHEGQLDPARAHRALRRRARAEDVDLWTGAEVSRLVPRADHVEVVLGDLVLRAGRVAVCTNAWSRRLLPELDVTPGRGQVLVTEPVPDLPFRGVFHLDEGYVYFRDVDGRLLLGGARHLDLDGEATTDEGLTGLVQDHLETLLHEVVLPGRSVSIAHRWSGAMAFGAQREPIVRRVDPRVAVGARLGGMGVALGAGVGADTAEALLGSTAR